MKIGKNGFIVRPFNDSLVEVKGKQGSLCFHFLKNTFDEYLKLVLVLFTDWLKRTFVLFTEKNDFQKIKIFTREVIKN